MVGRLRLDHNQTLNRYLGPVRQHNVHDLLIDERVLDQLSTKRINDETHECNIGRINGIDRVGAALVPQADGGFARRGLRHVRGRVKQ